MTTFSFNVKKIVIALEREYVLIKMNASENQAARHLTGNLFLMANMSAESHLILSFKIFSKSIQTVAIHLQKTFGPLSNHTKYKMRN